MPPHDVGDVEAWPPGGCRGRSCQARDDAFKLGFVARGTTPAAERLRSTLLSEHACGNY
jgi:hypothetical protein